MENILKGKRALFCGDSICAAGCEMPTSDNHEMLGWPGRFEKLDGMIVKNNGIDGRTIGITEWGEDKCIYHQFESEAPEYDVIVLDGGGNDGWAGSLPGKATPNDQIENFDINTFSGGLEYTFKLLKEKHPGAVLGFIIIPDTKNATVGHDFLKDMSAYWAEARIICEKWGIPCLDLYSSPKINEEMHMNDGACREYLYDGIHPTKKGYDVLYPVIKKWLEAVIGH